MTAQRKIRKHRRPNRRGLKPANDRCPACLLYRTFGDACEHCGRCHRCCGCDHERLAAAAEERCG